MSKPIQLLYIAGESRSGSTLLEMTLGQVQGFWPAGELRYLWSRGLVENQLCGCGSKFRDCAAWGKIIADAFGQTMLRDGKRVEEICRLQMAVDQPRSVFRNAFFSPKRYTRGFGQTRQRYVEALGKLYASVHDTTGAQWIIDSSKAPSHGWLARGCDNVQMHVVHLVRDCRAVAFSLQRKKARPEITEQPMFMPTYPVWKTALRWTLINKVCRNFVRQSANNSAPMPRHTGYTLVRYEDFIREPRGVVAAILRDLGMPPQPLDHIDGATVRLGPNHTVAGNPVRFKTGDIALKLDDQWRHDMPAMQRGLVRVIAGGTLRRYHYLPT